MRVPLTVTLVSIMDNVTPVSEYKFQFPGLVRMYLTHS